MREKIIEVLQDTDWSDNGIENMADKILSLLGENEIVVLDAPEVKHVGLLDVRGSDASEVKDTAIEQTSGAAFREMIETKEPLCRNCDEVYKPLSLGEVCSRCYC